MDPALILVKLENERLLKHLKEIWLKQTDDDQKGTEPDTLVEEQLIPSGTIGLTIVVIWFVDPGNIDVQKKGKTIPDSAFCSASSTFSAAFSQKSLLRQRRTAWT